MDAAKHVIGPLADDLGRLGLRRRDTVVLHSAFKALGLTNGTPGDVIATFLEVLGAGGTLVAPTFTYSYSGIWNVTPFDPLKTPGIANGILTETLRKWDGALRSEHPTYSVAAIGRHAKAITENRESASPLGCGSSYDTAIGLGAKVLLLGVGNGCNSALHYAEIVAGLPYNDIPFRAFWGTTAIVERDGRTSHVALCNEFPACSVNFAVADEYLWQEGLLTRANVLSAVSMLMDGGKMVQAVVRKLRTDPAWLLCGNFTCEPCTLRKKRLREKGMI